MCAMKSRLAWFLVLTLLLSALCGATVLAEEEKIEITIWGIDPTGVGDGNAEMIAALQAAFPQYEIKCEAMPASGGYDTQDLSKLTAAVAAGDPPDIAVLNAPFIMEVASRGMLEPINAYIEDLGIDLRETFYEYTIDEMTFQGDIWGLPSDTDCRILYYNKDMFEEAGLIAIGNPLKSSPDFPPPSTVHEGFPSHGAPSPSTFLFHTHDLERLDTHQSGFLTIVVQFGFLFRGQVQLFQQGLNGVLLRCV